MVSAGSSNSINEDPLHHSKHMKHEFAEEKLPLKDNNPYGQNIYGKRELSHCWLWVDRGCL